jgi:hypothetical protein
METFPITLLSLNASWGGANYRHQHLNLTVEAPIELLGYACRASICNRSPLLANTTALLVVVTSTLLTVAAAYLTYIIVATTRHLTILQLKVERLEGEQAHKIYPEKERHEQSDNAVEGDDDDNDGSIAKMDEVVFTPSRPERLSLESLTSTE